MRSIAGVVARPGEAMGRHVALRTGGPADWFVVVHRRESLAPALAEIKALGHKLHPLGAGTRMRFWDGPVRGAWLRLGTDFQRVHIQDDMLRAGAGVALPELLRRAAVAGLSGLEALAGLGGSLGAALALDEGPGQGWGALVEAVERVSRGKLAEVDLEAARKTRALIVTASIRLWRDDPDAIAQRMQEHRTKRWALGESPWWSRPGGGSVRAELQRVSMNGVRLRGVIVPEAAPELLANLGRGTAEDVALLQRSAAERVQKLRGVKLVSAGPWAGERSHGRTT